MWWDGLDSSGSGAGSVEGLVNMVMNFRFQKMLGCSSESEGLVASQRGFSSVELVISCKSIYGAELQCHTW
jgi:hypothetical protein